MTGHSVHIQVAPGDPRNDQAAAQTAADLDWHIENWARPALAADDFGPVEAISAMVGAFVEHSDQFPRERLAALLAAALVRLARATQPNENGREVPEEGFSKDLGPEAPTGKWKSTDSKLDQA